MISEATSYQRDNIYFRASCMMQMRGEVRVRQADANLAIYFF